MSVRMRQSGADRMAPIAFIDAAVSWLADRLRGTMSTLQQKKCGERGRARERSEARMATQSVRDGGKAGVGEADRVEAARVR